MHYTIILLYKIDSPKNEKGETMMSLKYRYELRYGSDAASLRLRYGSDAASLQLRYGSDVASLRLCYGSDAAFLRLRYGFV